MVRSIASTLTGTLRENASEPKRRGGTDITYFVAKELRMTERTYKRDLELVTVVCNGYLSLPIRCVHKHITVNSSLKRRSFPIQLRHVVEKYVIIYAYAYVWQR